MTLNEIHFGDCLGLMDAIPDESIDMILCDLPYGTTRCKWDCIIPFEGLWNQYKRIIKPNKAIVLTASQPFTSALIMSNLKMFRHEWIWAKDNASNFLNAKIQPLKYHESVVVFSSFKQPDYFPIKWQSDKISNQGGKAEKIKKNGAYNPLFENEKRPNTSLTRFPKSIINFNTPKNNDGINGCIHPTQKPVSLFEYLIKTYSVEGDTVLDNCSGSGTTAIACLNTDRKFICIEKDQDYFNSSVRRVKNHVPTKSKS